MNRKMRPIAFVGAVALLLGIAGTTLASDPLYATVTGYAVASEDNNHPEAWGDTCQTLEGVGNIDSYELPALDAGLAYDLVIVKAGSEGTGNNTLFADASAGETVWADTNENHVYDVGGPDGDKQISHVIVCTKPADQQEEGDHASLNVKKQDEEGHGLQGAIFTVEGMEGTFLTDKNGKFCVTGLPKGSEWLVTEIQAPAGYVIADPASQTVKVDNDGDCNSPSARFVNTLATASPTPTTEGSVQGSTSTPTPTTEGSVEGGTGTPAASQPDTAMGAQGGPGAIPAVAFAAILLAALGTLAWANVKARSRA
jgi:hypothetical protein